jgi:hypothetical protein
MQFLVSKNILLKEFIKNTNIASKKGRLTREYSTQGEDEKYTSNVIQESRERQLESTKEILSNTTIRTWFSWKAGNTPKSVRL